MILLPSSKISDISIYFLSEEAVSVQFGEVISEEILIRITTFNQLLSEKPFAGFKTSVAAYATLTVFYHPIEVIQSNLSGVTCFDKVGSYLKALYTNLSESKSLPARYVEIPTCYGGCFGPDLEYVAKFHGISVSEVINLHSHAEYMVFMIGFVPGFAYMGGMTDQLETPRKSQPRGDVPAGAVGIAGKQTGIYPLKISGGWQIIGQTPLKLFNLRNDHPALLRSGDRVRFKPIGEKVFKDLTEFENVG